MHTLILMRHAESAAGNPRLPDHARGLTEDGRCEADGMARWLADEQLVPQTILASSATRVRETVDRLREAWNDPPPTYYSDSLYLAPPEQILRSVRSDAVAGDRVMVVAHNPGLVTLVCAFAGKSLAMPPAAVVVFRLRIDDWSELAAGTEAEMVAYGCPELNRRR